MQLAAVTKIFASTADPITDVGADPDDLVDDDEDPSGDEPGVTGDARALDDISLTVARGTCLGIVGPPAAGKTTLIRMLAGTLVPTAGEVRVRGHVAPPPEALARLLELDAAGAANLLLLASLLGLPNARSERVDLATVYDLAGLNGLERAPLASIARPELQGLVVVAVLHLRPEVYLYDPGPKIADPVVRATIDGLLAERVRDGAIAVFTAEMPERLPAMTKIVARLHLGRLLGVTPHVARPPRLREPVTAGAALAETSAPPPEGSDPVALIGADLRLDDGPACLRIVVDVLSPKVELVLGFIVRPSAGAAAKVRSARYVLVAGRHEVFAYLGGLGAITGRCRVEIGALAGPQGEERAIMWPAPLECEFGNGETDAPHTAWRIERPKLQMVQQRAVAAREAPKSEHEHS